MRGRFGGLVASEDAVHRAVVQHLAAYGDPAAVVWHTPNQGIRKIAYGQKLRAMGVQAGMPDLMIFRGGRLYCLELKREKGGRVSRKQLECMRRLQDEGALCAVAAGVDEALAQLNDWGLLTRKPRT